MAVQMDEKFDPKFCRDYFIPVGGLRVSSPGEFDKTSREKLMYKGSKAIADGQICVVINAGGMG